MMMFLYSCSVGIFSPWEFATEKILQGFSLQLYKDSQRVAETRVFSSVDHRKYCVY